MHTPAHQLTVVVDGDDDFVVAGRWRSAPGCGVAKMPELQTDCCVHEEHACCAKEEGCGA